MARTGITFIGAPGATGLPLSPLADWSGREAPDKTATPLKQWERDWIWFEAWARYAWNPDVEPKADRDYWVRRLTTRYGPDRNHVHRRARRDRPAPLSARGLERAGGARQDGDAVEAVGARLDLVRGMGALCVESGRRAEGGSRLLG